MIPHAMKPLRLLLSCAVALVLWLFVFASVQAEEKKTLPDRDWSFIEVVKAVELSGKAFYKEFIGVTIRGDGVMIAYISDELKLGLRGEELFLERDALGKLKVVSFKMHDYYTYPDGHPKEKLAEPEKRIRLSHDCSLSTIEQLMKSDERIQFDAFRAAALKVDDELEISGSDSASPNQVVHQRVVLKCDPSGQWRIARVYSYDP